ncbi:transmembrane protein 5 [Arapaima gigas]
MKISCRKIGYCIVFLYLLFSFYAAYNVFFNTRVVSRVQRVVKKADNARGVERRSHPGEEEDEEEEWNPWEEEEKQELLDLQRRREAFRAYQERVAREKLKRHRVQIWGKAAIGLYLWEHILEGPLNPRDRTAQWREGEVVSGNITFSFYTGPAVVQGHVPLEADSLVLVLNGREEHKVSYATRWLQHVNTLVQSGSLSHVAVVLLGSERCANDWFQPYLRSRGGFVDFLFLVYDSPWVNGRDVFQWPLGVATYRDFPVVVPNGELESAARPYLCTFMGTVYKNSSRETMLGVLKQGWEKECLIAPRDKWLPLETADSMRRYRAALAQSDLTLCPVGVNTESYRIYEACSYGSVPVVEDVTTPGGCSTESGAPLRLLKARGAPFIFLRDWRELPGLLESERRRTAEEKAERRRRLLAWFADFHQWLKEHFTSVLEEAFFPQR